MRKRITRIFMAVWRSTSALIALALIALALAGGVWLGRATHSAPSDGASPAGAAGAETAEPKQPTTFTCSMHPQVRTTDVDARCPICFMDLVPVQSDGGEDDEGAERRLVMTEAAMKLAEVQTTVVERAFPTATIRLLGKVDFDETRIAQIAAYFPGRLDRLYVDYTGIPVRKGDHLVDIYSPELLAAQEELRGAIEASRSVRNGAEIVRMTTDATVRAAREKLRLWGLTDDQIRRIETTDDPMEHVTTYSPISGVVIEKHAIEGAYVDTGDPIYSVADLSQVWVRFEAYESQMPWLRFGQSVEFTTDSMPGETFEGRISFIDPLVSPTTRTISVRMNVDNPDRRLKPGMFVRGLVRAEVASRGVVIDPALAGKWISPMHPEIVKDEPGECDVCGMDLVPAEDLGYVVDEETLEKPLLAPASAPLITGRRALVYVRDPDADRPTFEAREVTLGPRAGDHYIVESGLSAGEQVVTHGAFKIDSALQIQGKPSMMNPAGEDAGDHHDHAEAAPQMQTDAPGRSAETPESLLRSLSPLYEAYLDAQEALADDALEEYAEAAESLREAMGRVDARDLTGGDRVAWEEARSAMRDALKDAPGDDLAAARRRFLTLSESILSLESRFGHIGSGSYYRAHCPMAFDFEGADWMQRTEVIDNPYFGASMLRCGEVRTEFTPRGLHGVEEGRR